MHLGLCFILSGLNRHSGYEVWVPSTSSLLSRTDPGRCDRTASKCFALYSACSLSIGLKPSQNFVIGVRCGYRRRQASSVLKFGQRQLICLVTGRYPTSSAGLHRPHSSGGADAARRHPCRLPPAQLHDFALKGLAQMSRPLGRSASKLGRKPRVVQMALQGIGTKG